MKIVSSGRRIHSQEFFEKKKRKIKIKRTLCLLSLFLIISSAVFISRLESLQIRNIEVVEEEIIDREEMKVLSEKILSGRYFWFIPKSNFIIYPRGDLRKTLLDKFPRLKSVELDLKKFQTLSIIPHERQPSALFCQNSECYFIDDEGLIFALVPSYSNVVYFTYTLETSFENPIGKNILETETFTVLSRFISDLSLLGVSAVGLDINPEEFSLILKDGGRIIWLRKDDFRAILSNLETFFSAESVRGEKNFFKRLLYLDLRTEDKVFYKFKNEA